MNVTHFVIKTVMAVLTLSVVSFSAQALTLCYGNVEQHPWLLNDGTGLRTVLLQEVAARTGVKLELVPVPWKNCLAGIEKGEFAGGFAASYSEERAKYAVYPMAEGKPDRSHRMHNDGYTLLRLKGTLEPKAGTSSEMKSPAAEPVMTSNTSNTPIATGLPEAELRKRLDTLTILLEDSDSEAADVVSELLDAIAGTPLAHALKPVAAAIDDVDFDTALERLSVLRSGR